MISQKQLFPRWCQQNPTDVCLWETWLAAGDPINFLRGEKTLSYRATILYSTQSGGSLQRRTINGTRHCWEEKKNTIQRDFFCLSYLVASHTHTHTPTLPRGAIKVYDKSVVDFRSTTYYSCGGQEQYVVACLSPEYKEIFCFWVGNTSSIPPPPADPLIQIHTSLFLVAFKFLQSFVS